MARPSIYTDEIAEEICERLSNGETLVEICADDHMPHRTTVFRWEESNQGFATRCARARVYQGDWHAHRVRVTADKCTPETAISDRVKVSAYQWLASKLDRKQYGEKVEHEHSGETKVVVRHDLSVLSLDELDGLERSLSKATVIDGSAEGDVLALPPPVR